MSDFVHKASIRRSPFIKLLRLRSVLICLFFIISGTGLFAQCPTPPTISPAGPVTFCSGDSVVLTSSATANYQWFKDGDSVQGAVNQTLTVTQSGRYTVKADCSDTSAPVFVTVNQVPKPAITPGGPLSFCSNDSLRLTSSSPSGNQWYVGNNLIADSVNPTLTLKIPGSYTVKVTAGGCSASSDTTVVTSTAAPAKPAITPGGPLSFCSNDSLRLTSSSPSGNQW
ncbi:MAG TPA: hypothetical protein VIL90_04410, partial [Puia sp.]